MTDPGPRCGWAEGNELDRAYHDEEWGVPKSGDSVLFESLTLEGAQAGLSWSTILKKRDGYRRAFLGFDPEAVAAMGPSDVDRLLGDASIVRHRGKIESTLSNAKAVLALRERGIGFSEFLWGFVDGTPILNEWRSLSELPSQTEASKAMSKALKAHGFRFVGPTTCYAFMQACGMVNDHEVGCFRHAQVAEAAARFRPGS